MYPLEFKGGGDRVAFSVDWTHAVERKEISGPIVLACEAGGPKCVSGLGLVDFEGEPESVEQVWVAAWIGEKLTLKNVEGNYLECLDGAWSARSKAVSSAGMLDVEEGWSLFSGGNVLKIDGVSEFIILTRFQEVEVEPLRVADLEKEAGRALGDAEVLGLYQAADRGELNEQLALMREKRSRRA